MLKASNNLAKEQGACELFEETNYAKGLLPIDTYKKDVDDIRDSLVPKLARYLSRENPKCLLINDPHLGDTLGEDHKNIDLKESLSDADIVYIAINHNIYFKNINEILSSCKKGTYIVDLWDVRGNEKIFFRT